MSQIRPLNTTVKTATDVYSDDLSLLDDMFDEEMDFHDEHLATLELTNQFNTHLIH